MPKFNTKVKEQVNYAQILFQQIDRIGLIMSLPELNIMQLSYAVDGLAAFACFLPKIAFDASDAGMDEMERYKKCITTIETIIKGLNANGLLFKYKVGGHVGDDEK